MPRDYPGMSEENELFLKEVLQPKGRMTVFYPEEVQLLLEELRGRLFLRGKFPFLAQPGLTRDKIAYRGYEFLLLCELSDKAGNVSIKVSDKCMYYQGFNERVGEQFTYLITRVPGAKDDTNFNWPFNSSEELNPWQKEIRDKYKASDPENWPKE